ncbi:hypothetical protein OC842_007613 [Tilletia horrida]|uniref:Uncharacterized protein n=1 Tax=Tilletia horrida TaxID=155126 RepID=A0AAN6G3J1_9BASI|nr:hypothetical protein OC842_007613 [Tilletia horrida]
MTPFPLLQVLAMVVFLLGLAAQQSEARPWTLDLRAGTTVTTTKATSTKSPSSSTSASAPTSTVPSPARCLTPGTARVWGYAVPSDPSVNSCYPKYHIRARAPSVPFSDGRVLLQFDDAEGGYLGFEVDDSTKCKGLYRLTSVRRANTRWIPKCTSDKSGTVVPVFNGTQLVSALATINNFAVLALAAASPATLDCYAKAIVNGKLHQGAIYTIAADASCPAALAAGGKQRWMVAQHNPPSKEIFYLNRTLALPF